MNTKQHLQSMQGLMNLMKTHCRQTATWKHTTGKLPHGNTLQANCPTWKHTAGKLPHMETHCRQTAPHGNTLQANCPTWKHTAGKLPHMETHCRQTAPHENTLQANCPDSFSCTQFCWKYTAGLLKGSVHVRYKTWNWSTNWCNRFGRTIFHIVEHLV